MTRDWGRWLTPLGVRHRDRRTIFPTDSSGRKCDLRAANWDPPKVIERKNQDSGRRYYGTERRSLPLAVLISRQREGDQIVAKRSHWKSVSSCRDNHILLSVGSLKCHRRSAGARWQFALPQLFSSHDVISSNRPIDSACHEDQPSRGDNRSTKRDRPTGRGRLIVAQRGHLSQWHGPIHFACVCIDSVQRTPRRWSARCTARRAKKASSHSVRGAALRSELPALTCRLSLALKIFAPDQTHLGCQIVDRNNK